MPADAEELELAVEDGVRFLELVAPVEQKDGKLVCEKMKLGDPDEKGRRSVADLVADFPVRLYPVGRLDKDSEGLLLFTNDGALMQAMTHPRHQVDKTYEVTVSGTLDGAAERLSAVDELDGEPIVPAQVTQVWRRGGQALLLVTIHQGKNRQIRRMCAKVDLQVMRLRRIAEDTLTLGSLPPGQWRYLTEAEVSALKGSERE